MLSIVKLPSTLHSVYLFLAYRTHARTQQTVSVLASTTQLTGRYTLTAQTTHVANQYQLLYQLQCV